VSRPRRLISLVATLLVGAVIASGAPAGVPSGAAAGAPGGVDAARWAEGRRAYHEAGGTGCAVCHGDFGANELGLAPVVRGADAARIHASLVTMETMTFLQGSLTDEEIDAMAYYLEVLDTMAPTIVTRRRSVLEPAAVALPAASHVQLILVNQDRAPCTWTVPASGAGASDVPGRTTGAIDWVTAEAGASLDAYCEEEPAMRVQLRIE
jgi:mono/diheme cytochrome c family protein